MARDATNLASMIAADLQLRGPSRMAWVDAKYMGDRLRSTRELEGALLALSVLGNANGAIPRERVIQSYRLFMQEHRELAGFVAGDLAAWQYWGAVPVYLALIKSNVRQNFASRVAISAYLRQSPIGSLIKSDVSEIGYPWISRQARNVLRFRCCRNDNRRSHRASPVMKRLLREPLVHFLLLGAILFGVYAYAERGSRRCRAVETDSADDRRPFAAGPGVPVAMEARPDAGGVAIAGRRQGARRGSLSRSARARTRQGRHDRQAPHGAEDAVPRRGRRRRARADARGTRDMVRGEPRPVRVAAARQLPPSLFLARPPRGARA